MAVGPEPVKVPAGVAIEAPQGLDVQVRPRSGLSSKGVMVAFGTVDSDYRGELLVTMYTLPHREPHIVHDGDRIAQMVISRVEQPALEVVEELTESARGAGGHGSTGR
jgi:dUTP pyrophosphatase